VWRRKQNLSTSTINLKVIDLASLTVGVNHVGRRLPCRIIENPFLLPYINLLVEDIFGGVTEVTLYNLTFRSEREFLNMYYTGLEIEIAEPYYKLRGDGYLGVQVDNPGEVSFKPFPKSSIDYKELEMGFVALELCCGTEPLNAMSMLYHC